MRVSRMAVLALVLAACSPPAPLGFTDEDRAIIQAQRQAFEQAVNVGDWITAASIYEEDGIAMPPNSPAWRGRIAIKDALTAGPALGDFVLSDGQFITTRDYAIVTGTYRIVVMPPGATVAIPDTGKYVEVWRRQPDGAWKLAQDIWNSDRSITALVPPAAGR